MSPAPRRTPVAVAVVDNHEAVLDGVANAAQLHPHRLDVVRRAGNVDDIDFRTEAAPDVVVLNLYLGRDDVTATPWIPRLRGWGAKVLLHTTCEFPVPLRTAVRAGARGLVLKNDGLDELIAAIFAVAAGEFVCSSTLARSLLLDRRLVADLTTREVEVLQAIDDGLSHGEAARRLGVAESTIKAHLKSVRQRYLALGRGGGNAHGLLHEARRDGWI